MYRLNIVYLLLFTMSFVLAGCAANLPGHRDKGYAIVIFPDDGNSTVWRLQGKGDNFTPRLTDVGGGYRAAVLEPGTYTLSGVHNVSKISALGRGAKDLDFADRDRKASLSPDEIDAPLGLAMVKRPPVKEERGGGKFGVEHVVDISSEYRMSLSLPDGQGRRAWFEVGPGEVVLLPALCGEIALSEQSCTRNGFVTVFYTPFVLSYAPEDFQFLEWYCPLDKLTFTLLPARLDALRAGADPESLPPVLMERIEQREIHLEEWFKKAQKIDKKNSGQVEYIFPGP